MQKLTQKQAAFCDAYRLHGNATKAYEEAGYSVKNMAPATIRGTANGMLNLPHIAAHIKEHTDKIAKKVDYTQEAALRMAMADWKKARDMGQMGAAIAANQLASKLSGYLSDKLQFEDVTKRVVGTEPIPENEWEAQYQDGPKTNGAKKNGNGTAA